MTLRVEYRRFLINDYRHTTGVRKGWINDAGAKCTQPVVMILVGGELAIIADMRWIGHCPRRTRRIEVLWTTEMVTAKFAIVVGTLRRCAAP